MNKAQPFSRILARSNASARRSQGVAANFHPSQRPLCTSSSDKGPMKPKRKNPSFPAPYPKGFEFFEHVYPISSEVCPGKSYNQWASEIPSNDANFPSIMAKKGGRIAVWLHGILGQKRNLRTPISKFLDSNPQFKTISVDHRGHGKSSLASGLVDDDRDVEDGGKYMAELNTVDACAEDLVGHLFSHRSSPDIIAAHSFGGKVGLAYLQRLLSVKETTPDLASILIPTDLWILDSMPTPYIQTDDKNTSNVMNLIENTPPFFASRDWLIDRLVSVGMPTTLVYWLASNVIELMDVETGKPSKAAFTFDKEVVKELYSDFCQKDMMPFLEGYSGDCNIHFVRAGKNKQWKPELVDRLRGLEAEKKGKIRFHTMENAGHWLHSEDPAGLAALMTKESSSTLSTFVKRTTK